MHDPAAISRRIEKLAKEAGRTPAQMLKFVIGDGLEQTEYAVREADAGLAELDAGNGIPLGKARRRAEARATVLPRTVELSPRVERQLAQIEDHTLRQAGPSVADKVVSTLFDAMERLGVLPVV